MKGIIIYGNPMWGDNERATYCEFMNEASFELTHYAPKTIISRLEGVPSETSKAVCSEDDSYDFETGALIALMKMCGVDKVVRACNEAFSYETDIKVLRKDNNNLREANKGLQEENEKLKEEIKCLKIKNKYLIEDINRKFEYITEFKRSNDVLKEENEKLKLDCEKLCHGYVDTDMIFCGGRGTGKQYKALVELFKKIDQKKVDAAYVTAYKESLIWCTSQSSIRDFLDKHTEQINKLTVDSLIEQSRAFTQKCVDEWLYKIPTKREKMWERILELHKENDVIIVVEKEDVITFLHEIEDKIPEITWASDVKIFEAKGTIKDIYEELITHNIIYFRLSKKNKLSYSSDPDIYQYKDLEHISYLPPMRWDLFKKGRLAVKVDFDNYKEFYEACKKELGKRPLTNFACVFTVSICKDDGFFEIFTVEDQKKTGRKIVDWEDVR